MRSRRVAALLAAAGLALPLAGCQKISRSVSASVSPCFRILPEAHAALGGQGSFVDVARIKGRAVTRFPRVGPGVPSRIVTSGGDSGAGVGGGGQPQLAPPPAALSAPTPTTRPVGATSPSTTVAGATRDVCVVAYRGTFDTVRIQHLIGLSRTGRYALVIVGVKAQRVRAVLLVDRLPAPLHAH